jgi:hypothetical protein
MPEHIDFLGLSTCEAEGGGLPPENFEKPDVQWRFPAISEAERHTHKMHIFDKF